MELQKTGTKLWNCKNRKQEPSFYIATRIQMIAAYFLASQHHFRK
uniref:Uncharacterized protein n=1 Tax=Arundo donax TaxID=35708 RepID=A0A0A9FQ98_ARUDO